MQEVNNALMHISKNINYFKECFTDIVSRTTSFSFFFQDGKRKKNIMFLWNIFNQKSLSFSSKDNDLYDLLLYTKEYFSFR
jgi:hypothetical protein